MKNRRKIPPGSIIRISLSIHCYAYGRILNFRDMAIYDLQSSEGISELSEIVKMPIIFKGFVGTEHIEDGTWPILGCLPLNDSLQSSKYWLPEVGHKDKCKIFDNGNWFWLQPLSAGTGLFSGSIWRPEHIDEWLINHFSGFSNDKFNLDWV
ncbi:Imm26 family immunity protein [Pedobacter nutrimenti]|uniref:Imm26 family immunity protein n=1 Tax=Pedobacter nutrimenti TaxID=1241337 RepID=UPI002931E0CE|nr:Imm26 family immunity protein [Pedobacter nutrimenti]